ncbi:hypothetical protein H0H92_015087 [Tricholoma furcatifolium]|nr:hypothetical protein H0H92_015087 [Tricholoma furcatifolium]
MPFDDDSHKLPPAKECGLEEHGHSLWIFILEAEKHALEQPSSRSSVYQNPLVGIRVLGFLFMDLYGKSADPLGIGPYHRLRKEILSCQFKPEKPTESRSSEEMSIALQDLGLHYRNHLMRVFRTNTGWRSASSSDSDVSRPSFDAVKGRVLDELGAVSQTKSSPRAAALLRDGYKCTLSGLYDRQSTYDFPELQGIFKAQGQTKKICAEVAHILSESAQDGDQSYAATVFAILKLFGLEQQAKALYRAGVNGLHNVITMDFDFYQAFHTLSLWLEPVPDKEDTYVICGTDLESYTTPFKKDRVVTFTVHPSAAAAAKSKGKNFDLPDRTMLALRAACCRVAHMSGAAEHINLILRDVEDITFLADDGSMADLLSCRLSTAQPRAFQAQG